MTRQADLKRRVRARMARTGESFAAARAHVVADRPDESGLARGALHVTNGDMTVPALRRTGLAETIVAWRDVLHEGPAPDVSDAALRRVRAAFLRGEGAADIGTLAELTERDRILDAHRDRDYVLWFEADLYDQSQLVQILARRDQLAVEPNRITLICIGEHLGIAPFGGLGQLDAEQLARLPAITAHPMTSAALRHASSAWRAFRAGDPSGFGAVVSHPSPELRFVSEAFDRLAREYPSTRDGLALTERRILAAVADGATTAHEAFTRSAARETRPFLGDSWCFDRMTRLARASTPLLSVAGGETSVRWDTAVQLTPAGRRVLDGRGDHVALSGIDRWIGGTHLVGHTVPWRWHESIESIVASER